GTPGRESGLARSGIGRALLAGSEWARSVPWRSGPIAPLSGADQRRRPTSLSGRSPRRGYFLWARGGPGICLRGPHSEGPTAAPICRHSLRPANDRWSSWPARRWRLQRGRRERPVPPGPWHRHPTVARPCRLPGRANGHRRSSRRIERPAYVLRAGGLPPRRARPAGSHERWEGPVPFVGVWSPRPQRRAADFARAALSGYFATELPAA